MRDGVAVDALALLGKPLDERGGVGDLSAAFGQGLALLGRHDEGEILGVVDHQGEQAAQDGGALLTLFDGDCGHPGGGGAGTLAVGEHVQVGDRGLVHEVQRLREQHVRLGRETGDQVGADGQARAQAAGAGDGGQGVGPAVAAAHPFQHQVGPGLHGQVQMRHQPWLVGQQPPQVVVEGRRVQRGQSQARQVRHQGQQAPYQCTQGRTARKVRAVGADVHPGQHDLTVAGGHQPPNLLHDATHR